MLTICLGWLLFLFHQCCADIATGDHQGSEPWNLPVFPATLPDYSFMMENSKGKLIPRHLWIGFKKIPSPEEMSGHLQQVLERANSTYWTIHLLDDAAQDAFMDKYFHNTSVNWAYHTVNPEIGAAKGDIWRYCALYLFGGFYLDDDSYIGNHLDDLLHKDDQLVLTYERNKDRSTCFKNPYHLSRECLNEKFHRKTEIMFSGNVLVTWAMAAMPRHRLYYRALETVVDSVRSQYLGRPIQWFGMGDFHVKWIFCTTGPNMITAVAREVFAEQDLLEQQRSSAALDHPATPVAPAARPGDANFTYTYTLHGRDFGNFGGRFKPVFGDVEQHYMFRMNKHRIPLLRAYADIGVGAWEGKVVTASMGREMFLVENGTRRSFRDWDAFVDNHFTLKEVVHVEKVQLDAIPFNAAVVTSVEAAARVEKLQRTMCTEPDL